MTFDAALQQQVADLQRERDEAVQAAAAALDEAATAAWQMSRIMIAAERLVKQPHSPACVKQVKALLNEPPSASLQRLVQLRERCDQLEHEVGDLRAQLPKGGF